MTGSVAGLVLAAGAGSRFGGPKALVALDGELLVSRAVRLLTEGGCEHVLVVLGAQADRVRAQVDLPHVVVAAHWATGMGASLRAGLAALRATPAQACVVALADQPLVGAPAVARLIAARRSGAVAAVATYAGRPRNPVLLGQEVWGEVAARAVGDTGARPWLRACADRVQEVPCDDTGSPYDIDTPADLAALAAPVRDGGAEASPDANPDASPDANSAAGAGAVADPGPDHDPDADRPDRPDRPDRLDRRRVHTA